MWHNFFWQNILWQIYLPLLSRWSSTTEVFVVQFVKLRSHSERPSSTPLTGVCLFFTLISSHNYSTVRCGRYHLCVTIIWCDWPKLELSKEAASPKMKVNAALISLLLAATTTTLTVCFDSDDDAAAAAHPWTGNVFYLLSMCTALASLRGQLPRRSQPSRTVFLTFLHVSCILCFTLLDHSLLAVQLQSAHACKTFS